MQSKAVQIFFLMFILLRVVIELLKDWYEGCTMTNIFLGAGALFIIGLMIRIGTRRYWK
jgi:hypothetical protein